MQVRALIAVNALFALGLAALFWVMMPFAAGVRCEAVHTSCSTFSFVHRAGISALPLLVVLFVAWGGAVLYRRNRFGGYFMLAFCPIVVVGWVILVWFGLAS